VIIRSFQAESDLIAIWLTVAGENPFAADRVLDGIDARSRQLLAHPYSGTARDDISPGIRCLVDGNYRIFYRLIEPDTVELVRIMHGRRDIDADDFQP